MTKKRDVHLTTKEITSIVTRGSMIDNLSAHDAWTNYHRASIMMVYCRENGFKHSAELWDWIARRSLDVHFKRLDQWIAVGYVPSKNFFAGE